MHITPDRVCMYVCMYVVYTVMYLLTQTIYVATYSTLAFNVVYKETLIPQNNYVNRQWAMVSQFGCNHIPLESPITFPLKMRGSI